MTHNIPLGSLVEIKESSCHSEGGLRLFVAGFHFDCDGITPLYRLSLDKEMIGKSQNNYLDEGKGMGDNYKTFLLGVYQGSTINGFVENDLILIKNG